jgi:hypothetical protein
VLPEADGLRFLAGANGRQKLLLEQQHFGVCLAGLLARRENAMLVGKNTANKFAGYRWSGCQCRQADQREAGKQEFSALYYPTLFT